MEEMTFGARSSGLGGKLARLEVKEYLYLGIGAFAYYSFAKEALHPKRKSGAEPTGQAAYAGLKLMSALFFHRTLKDSGLVGGNAAAFATVAGAFGLEWYLRKDHPVLLPAVGWGHEHDWEQAWEGHRHHHHEPNFWEHPGW